MKMYHLHKVKLLNFCFYRYINFIFILYIILICFHHVEYVFRAKLALEFLAKWLSVLLQIKWLWAQVPLQSLRFQASHLF